MNKNAVGKPKHSLSISEYYRKIIQIPKPALQSQSRNYLTPSLRKNRLVHPSTFNRTQTTSSAKNRGSPLRLNQSLILPKELDRKAFNKTTCLSTKSITPVDLKTRNFTAVILGKTEIREKVKVFLRLRPMIFQEATNELNPERIWKIAGSSLVNAFNNKRFSFDEIFNETLPTEEIYHKAIKNYVQSALEGFNISLVCFGQSGTGKTFSLEGDSDRGIYKLILEGIFSYIELFPSRKFVIWLSMFEIRQNSVFDLLHPKNKILGFTPNGQIKDISSQVVTSQAAVEKLICSQKAIGHKIVRFIIESKSIEKASEEPIYHSMLQIIDMKDNYDQRVFSELICSLAIGKKHLSLPSLMGQYLQSTLERNTKLAVLCTLSPALSAYEKSIFTINMGINAGKIEQVCRRNLVENPDKALIYLYEQELEALEKKLTMLEQYIKKIPELGQIKELIQSPIYRKNITMREQESWQKRMSGWKLKQSTLNEERKQLCEQIRNLKSYFLSYCDDTSTTSHPTITALDITVDMEKKLEKTFSTGMLRTSSICPLDSFDPSPIDKLEVDVKLTRNKVPANPPNNFSLEKYQEQLKVLRRQVRTLEIVKEELFDENDALKTKISQRVQELVRVKAEIARYNHYLCKKIK